MTITPDWKRNPTKYEADEYPIKNAVLCWTRHEDTHDKHQGRVHILREGDPRIPQFACAYGADDDRWKLQSTEAMIAWMLFVGAHRLVHRDGISPARVRRALMRISEIKAMSEWYFSP